MASQAVLTNFVIMALFHSRVSLFLCLKFLNSFDS
jgi:hypothetical protein